MRSLQVRLWEPAFENRVSGGEAFDDHPVRQIVQRVDVVVQVVGLPLLVDADATEMLLNL
jgi:hypothetical protein